MSFNFICDILKSDFLKEWWVTMPEKLEEEYLGIVQDILDNEEFQSLKKYYHHNSSIYKHSLRVSYYSYKVAKVLELDFEAVARGGLLHDFFSYDWREYKKNKNNKNHGLEHPKTALKNARKHFQVTKKEEDIILKHMWPKVFGMPKFKESVLVSMVDKYCATEEFYGGYKELVQNKIKIFAQAS